VAIELGEQLGFWMILPFAAMLLAIAVLPVAAGHWFESNRNKGVVAAVLGVPTVAYLLARYGGLGWESAVATAEEYVAFIVLLTSLYTISGGIYLTGNLLGTPRVNATFLLVGAVLANFIGTTGAAMVLIRPLLRANSERRHTKHVVVFFIFVVCNIGGMLTPLGDPPLFLGFLRGVSFGWTLRLWPQWLFTTALVVLVFLALERYFYRRETFKSRREDEADYVPMRIAGKANLFLLGLVIVVVLLSGPLHEAGAAIHFPLLREVALIVLALASLKLGPRGPRASNHFCWHPMVEVGVIFAGIFATMIPALAILQAKGGAIGLDAPWQYFWSTGALSAFLDNAPTYLAFTSVAQGQVGVATIGGLMSTAVTTGASFAPAAFLTAISTGAVMMGANSYIGNAPNLMVKCISTTAGVRMPSFFGYVGWGAVILLPIYAIVTAVFLI